MYAYTYPLFLVTHSLIHKLTQAIMHAYVTLEPQVRIDHVLQCRVEQHLRELLH